MNEGPPLACTVRSTYRRLRTLAALISPVGMRSRCVHALRHLYASVLLDAGESVKALAQYLGRSDPGFTLRVYTDLLPTSHERTRRAVDGFLSEKTSRVIDGLETAWAMIKQA
jgi:integrase